MEQKLKNKQAIKKFKNIFLPFLPLSPLQKTIPALLTLIPLLLSPRPKSKPTFDYLPATSRTGIILHIYPLSCQLHQ